jgi:molybdate-binding protein/DNA-binding XRE family transcriptional regulator
LGCFFFNKIPITTKSLSRKGFLAIVKRLIRLASQLQRVYRPAAIFLAQNDTIIAMNDRFISTHPVQARRLARDWSQADLAERAGISRAAVSAIEGERLSPSVATALALAAVFECSVEELFGRAKTAPVSAPDWAWLPRGDASRYWEAAVGGRRRLYPVEAVGLNPTPHDGVWQNGVLRDGRPSLAEATLVMACCDPAAGLLAAEYARESGFRLLVLPRGGRAALELLRQKLVHIAGLHYSTEAEPERNLETVRAHIDFDSRLLRAAKWEAGIALASSDRSRSVESLARRPLRWAAREPGSAARECLDELLKGRRFAGREVRGHASVAEAVGSGWADAGVCVRFSAEGAGLNFLPLRTETLDLCFHEALQHDPRIKALVRLLRERAYRQLVSELPGYDARETGEMASL